MTEQDTPVVRRRRIRWRRGIVVAIGLFIILGGLAGVKFWQISTLIAVGKDMQAKGPPPETVASAVAKTESWPVQLQAVGTVAGVDSVSVSTEASGIVTKLRFESGDIVKKDQPLVELDSDVEQAQLKAAVARRDLAKIEAGRSRTLVEKGAVPQSELDSNETALAAAESEIKTIQAQIEHKVVRAPFAGRAGIRTVHVGQFLAAGTAVTTVESIAGLWVDFTLPQEQLAHVKVGTPVRVALRGQPAFDGTVSAVDSTVDPATRSVKLRATLSDKQAPLRSGMFVTVTVVLPTDTTVVVVPATAIVHAPYGDSVFLIEDKIWGSPGMTKTPDGKEVKIARQQFVRLGVARGDFVAISEGVKAGQQVVSIGGFKLRNGSPIVIDNRVQPKFELAPKPENR
ncbi:MAG TPA: efflux RND transporter periplasmic adaptor subunit [Kofleriaceae bacterium]|nr:efflux RND transporter periplasmic adaptor subunit [Kofleriaceae bacterium]